jgi:ABC-type Fe3+-hydroxamate transport system substrate-binding protein
MPGFDCPKLSFEDRYTKSQRDAVWNRVSSDDFNARTTRYVKEVFAQQDAKKKIEAKKQAREVGKRLAKEEKAKKQLDELENKMRMLQSAL